MTPLLLRNIYHYIIKNNKIQNTILGFIDYIKLFNLKQNFENETEASEKFKEEALV